MAEEMNRPERRMEQLLDELRQDPSLPGRLMGQDGEIVRQALDGQSVHEIAQNQSIPESEVWSVLGQAARMATGEAVEPTETAGLGSDTDPGVTGGYCDTAFGSIGNEPPIPTPEEPDEET